MVRRQWCVKEDVVLMLAWCFVSKDKACFRNNGSLWGRIHKLYVEAQKENPGEISERNLESLKGRFKRLNVNVNKWVAAYKKAHGRKRSGMSQQDIVLEAQTIYEAGGHRFEDLYVFNEVMSKHPKWEINLDHDSTPLRVEDEEGNKESGGGSKRSRTGENGVYSIPINPETPVSGGSAISRPIGRDKEGKKEKYAKIAADIRALRLARGTEVEVTCRLEIERAKMDLEREKMKHSILMALLAKDHLSPFEEEMKLHLLPLFK